MFTISLKLQYPKGLPPPHCFLLSNFKLTVLFHFLFATCMYIYTGNVHVLTLVAGIFVPTWTNNIHCMCTVSNKYHLQIQLCYNTISIQNGNIGIWFINLCIQYCWCAGAPKSLTVPQWRNMSHSNPYMFKYWYCLQLV